MALATDDVDPGRLASAINDLLMKHGYPPDQVGSWWHDWPYEALDGRTPAQAWEAHEYQRVWDAVRSSYDASETSALRLAGDPAHAAAIDERIRELQHRYGD